MTEEEYNSTLTRLVKGAEYLENPLLSEKDRIKGQRLYDALEYKIRAYKEATGHEGSRENQHFRQEKVHPA